uniref:RING-type domain-containing protein n=2 Tax=Strongyloides stercoralis TaxID=6248 RepID=A0AAF5D3V2_STRER
FVIIFMDNSSVNTAVSRSHSSPNIVQVQIPPSDIYNFNRINLQYMNPNFPNTSQHIGVMDHHVNINSNGTNNTVIPNISTAVPSISQPIQNLYDFDIQQIRHLPIREPDDVIQIGIELQRHRDMEFEHARTNPYEPLSLTRTYHVHRNNLTGRITLIRDSNNDLQRRSDYITSSRDCYMGNSQSQHGISLQRSEETSDNQVNYVPYRQPSFPYTYEGQFIQQPIIHQTNGYQQPQHSISTSFHQNSVSRPSTLSSQRQKRPHGNQSSSSNQSGASRLPKMRRVNSTVEDNLACTSQNTSEHQDRPGFTSVSTTQREIYENTDQRHGVPRPPTHHIHASHEPNHQRNHFQNTWPMSIIEINRQIMNSLYTIEANIPHAYPHLVYPIQQGQIDSRNVISSNSHGSFIRQIPITGNPIFTSPMEIYNGRQYVSQPDRVGIFNHVQRSVVDNIEMNGQTLEQFHQNNRAVGMAVPFIAGFSPADFHYIQAFTHYGIPQVSTEAAPVGLSGDDIKKFTTIMPFSKDSNCGENESERCTVCLCDFDSGDEVRLLNCSHKFHVECIDQWLSINKKCPLCREDVDKARDVNEEPSGSGRNLINSTVHSNVHSQATIVDV